MTKVRITLALVFGCLLVVASAGSAGLVSAAHESNNQITFRPVADPDASGRGVINYVAGREGEANEWTGAFNFKGLTPGETYTVSGAGGANPTAICTFTAKANGSGGCNARFGVFAGGQVRVTDSDGTLVLLGSRANGDIISNGGNRD